MALKPYTSISKIAAAAARAGHVVGVEEGKTVIETGTATLTFHADRTITDGAGKSCTMDEALKALGISLT